MKLVRGALVDQPRCDQTKILVFAAYNFSFFPLLDQEFFNSGIVFNLALKP